MLYHWTWCWRSGLDCLASWADNWQASLVGFVAVLAAIGSIVMIERQIASGEHQESNRRRAKVEATRLRLSVSLSDIEARTYDALEIFRGYLDALADNEDADIGHLLNRPPPEMPEADLLLFADLVENIDDMAFSNYLGDAARSIRAYNRHLSGFPFGQYDRTIFRLENRVFHAAEIYAYAAGMVRYARRETDIPPRHLDWSFGRTALTVNFITRDKYPNIYELIARNEAWRERERAPAVTLP